LYEECSEKSQEILKDLALQYKTGPLSAECISLASCGLMGDNKVYGYAWGIKGIDRFDPETWQGIFKEMGTRLTNEVVADDGTRFVRVFVEVPLPPAPETAMEQEKGKEGEEDGISLV